MRSRQEEVVMFRAIRASSAVVAVVALAVVLGACSSGRGGPSVASLEDPGGSAAPQSSAPTDPQEAFLAYSACMRENGVDMPDPEVVEDDSGGEDKGFGFRVGGPAGSV